MGPLKGTVLLTALTLCVLYMAGPTQAEQCDQVQWNTTFGENPFVSRRGKVVLVAFLKGYCSYCITQATNMYRLKQYLSGQGYPDIDMLIINGGEASSRSLVNNLIDASPLPVIQDTSDHVLYRQVFGAYKDDFLVYDRCGQAAIYIPHPYSDLRRNIVPRVLAAVHGGRHECYCDLDYNSSPNTRVKRTAGGGPGNRRTGDNEDDGSMFYRTHDMTRGMMHCAPTDTMCHRFQRRIDRRIGFGSREDEFNEDANNLQRQGHHRNRQNTRSRFSRRNGNLKKRGPNRSTHNNNNDDRSLGIGRRQRNYDSYDSNISFERIFGRWNLSENQGRGNSFNSRVRQNGPV